MVTRSQYFWAICAFVIYSAFLLIILELPGQPKLITRTRPPPSAHDVAMENIKRNLIQNQPQFHAKSVRCQPRDKIVSIKTHKTAGSTLTSIFQRYGMSRNLIFATPVKISSAFKKPGITSTNVYEYQKVMKYWGSFDMLVCHGLYNRTELEKIVMNATYITAIRNPVGHFVSSFIYYNYSKQAKITNSGNVLLKLFNTKKFASKIGYGKHQLFNGIAHDLVVNASGNITQEIQRLDREFDLVILSEYFDESLILLRKLLCWEIDDLLYLSIRKHTNIYDHLYNVSDEVKSHILRINKIDAAIYDYFEQIFWRRVEAYGPTFDDDLQELRHRLRALEEECSVSNREGYEMKRGFRTYNIMANDTEYCKNFLIIDELNTKQSHRDLTEKLTMFEGQLEKSVNESI